MLGRQRDVLRWRMLAAAAPISAADEAEEEEEERAVEGLDDVDLTLLCSERNQSGYKNVYISKSSVSKPYYAQVSRRGKSVTLGFFATAVEAAHCYAPSPEGRKAMAAAAASTAAAQSGDPAPIAAEDESEEAEAEESAEPVRQRASGHAGASTSRWFYEPVDTSVVHLCGVFGCPLPAYHPGLHQAVVTSQAVGDGSESWHTRCRRPGTAVQRLGQCAASPVEPATILAMMDRTGAQASVGAKRMRAAAPPAAPADAPADAPVEQPPPPALPPAAAPPAATGPSLPTMMAEVRQQLALDETAKIHDAELAAEALGFVPDPNLNMGDRLTALWRALVPEAPMNVDAD